MQAGFYLYNRNSLMMKRKKVAIVTPGLLPVPAVNGGAVETLITDLIEGNEEDFHYEFTVYTCADERLNKYQYKHCDIVQVKNKGIRRYVSYIRTALSKLLPIEIETCSYLLFLKKVDWERYDEILVENSMRVYENLYKIIKTNGKLSYHMHNDVETEKGDKSPERSRLILRTSKNFLTVSNYIRRSVCSVSTEDYSDKVKVLYNCVDRELFSRNNADKKSVRLKYHISKDDFVVMYSGRITEEKGVLELCKAVSHAIEKGYDIKLLIVGCCWFPDIMDSPYMDEVLRLMEGHSDHVIFTGFQPSENMPQLYELASVVVIPTLNE